MKSQKVVNFPFKNFDPTPYLASVPQETILRHKELIEHGNTNALTNGYSSCSNSNIENDSSPSEMTPEHSIMSDSIREVDAIDTESTAMDLNSDVMNDISKIDEINRKNNDHHSETKSHSQSNNTNKLNNQDAKVEQGSSSKPSIHSSKRVSLSSSTSSTNMRKRLVSTSLAKSPVIDGAFVDYHNHHLDEGQDAFDLKYKLYAVVVRINIFFSFFKSVLMTKFCCISQSHSGMLNGGHYISYASNPNNSWYCYNDSSCREISQQQPNIDPSSAYLLFYERQGLNYAPYLPKVDGKSVPINSGLEFDDSDNDLRKMCVIS